MVRGVKPAAIAEMRIGQAECRSLGIHESHKLRFVASHMLHRCKTCIVGGYDEHGLQQVFQPKNLPCLHAQVRLVRSCGIGANRDKIIQPTPFKNDESRHDFCEAGRGHSLPRIMFIQHMPALKFFEKNAMGWSDSPRREPVGSDRSSNRNRVNPGVLRKNDGRSEGLGTDQE